MPVFIAAIIENSHKVEITQVSTDGRMCHIHTMEYY